MSNKIIRLGLDIGTNSVGYALVEMSQDEKLEKIITLGSRIIKEEDIHRTFKKGKTETKCAERTTYRGTRRTYDRYVKRRERLKTILKEKGMFSSELINIGQGNKGEKSEMALYKLRAEAPNKQITLEELGRVLYLLIQRRGLKINKKEVSSKDTEYLEEVKRLTELLEKKENTIGQLLYNSVLDKSTEEKKEDVSQNEESKPITRLRGHTFLREKYIEEFNQIWDKQAEFYPEVLTNELKETLRDDVIYFQRPLKSCKHLIANCEFEPNHKVIAKSSPLFQVFSIWQTINNIVVIDKKGVEQKPDIELLRKLFLELNTNKNGLQDKSSKITGSKILELLNFNSKEYSIKYEKGIKGNTTYRRIAEALKKGGVEAPEQYLHFDYNDIEVKEGLYDIWHILFSIEKDKDVKNTLKKHLNLNDEEVKYLSEVSFKSDYGSLSAKVIRKILPYLEQGCMYSEAMARAGYNHSKKEIKEVDRLEQLSPTALRNPVVTQVINQVINISNDIIDKYGKPTEIIVELARELQQSAEKREEMTQAIREEADYHKKIEAKLKEHSEYKSSEPSKNDLLRYKLWEQTGKKCLYSGKTISLTQLYNGETDIEHIIPRSLRLDDAQANKIISFKYENNNKGQRTAYEYMESKGEEELKRYIDDIKYFNEVGYERADGKKKKINNIKKKNLLKTTKDLEKEEDFVSAQANATAYITRKTVELLNQILPPIGDKKRVHTTSGGITDKLRNDWGLLELLQDLNVEKYGRENLYIEKRADSQKNVIEIQRLKIGEEKDEKNKYFTKRDDQRHHALDALITALTTHKIVHRLNNAHRDFREKEELKKESEQIKDFKKSNTNFSGLIPHPNLRQMTKDALLGVLVSYNKPKRKAVSIKKHKIKGKVVGNTLVPKGAIHEATMFRSIKVKEYYDIDVNKAFTKANNIANKEHKKQISKILEMVGNDIKKARKYVKDNPIMDLDDNGIEIPLKKVTIWEEKEVFSKRKNLSSGLTEAEVRKILDRGIKSIIEQRIKERGKDAFKNLDKDPIRHKNGHIIKSVRLQDNSELVNIHNIKETSRFVSLGNNHHAIVYKIEEGKLDDRVISLFNAVGKAKNNIETKGKSGRIIDMNTCIYDNEGKEYKPLMSIKENDLFYFGTELKTREDFLNPRNNNKISKHLFRVQKISKGDYWFRHHLETKVEEVKGLDNEKLKNIFKRIRSLKDLPKVKLHIDALGEVNEVEIYEFGSKD